MVVFQALNDPAFVRRAIAGDPDAFQEIFDCLAVPLARFVEKMGLRPDDAEEVAADALAKVHRSLRGYRHRGTKLTTWIFQIAHNCAVDFRRAASRKSAQDQEFCLEYRRADGHESASVIVRTAAEVQALSKALDSLSVADRDILRMREVMDYSEIALAEGTTEEAARVRHKRAFDRLKLQLSNGRSHA